MMVFQCAVDATFTAFGIDALYTPAGGEPVYVRVIAKRPDTTVGFDETRIHAETATFEVRASEVASPRPMISSRSAARPSSCRASRSDAIRTGSYGRSMCDQVDRSWVCWFEQRPSSGQRCKAAAAPRSE
jgi:hypothetical protein